MSSIKPLNTTDSRSLSRNEFQSPRLVTIECRKSVIVPSDDINLFPIRTSQSRTWPLQSTHHAIDRIATIVYNFGIVSQ